MPNKSTNISYEFALRIIASQCNCSRSAKPKQVLSLPSLNRNFAAEILFAERGIVRVGKKIVAESLTLRCGVGLCAERANESNTQTSRTCVMPLSFGRIINSQHLLRSRQVADVFQSDRNFYANHCSNSTDSMRCNTFKRYNFQNFYGIANSSRQASVALICEHTTQGDLKSSVEEAAVLKYKYEELLKKTGNSTRNKKST